MSASGMGGWNHLLYLLGRALEKASGARVRLVKYYFFAQPVSRIDASASAGGKTVVTEVSREDPVVPRFPRPPQVVARRFRTGGRCFTASMDGEFIGFLWIHHTEYREDEVRCIYRPLPPDRVAWDYDVYLEPRFRLTRAFKRIWDGVHEQLAREGYQWTMSRISAFNPQSLSSHRRLGAVFLGAALFLVLGRMQISLLPRPPFVQLSFSEEGAPVLYLHAPGAASQGAAPTGEAWHAKL